MKILFLSAWFPYPPDNGARIRAYNLMKGLSQKHEVFMISLLQDDSNAEDSRYLSDICEVVSVHESNWFKPRGMKSLLALFSNRPRSVVCTYDDRIRMSIENAISRIAPDVIVASSLGIAHYVPQGVSVPKILDQHNCEYAVMKRAADKIANPLKRWRAAAGWKKAARWEANLCRRFDAITAVSGNDRALILKAAPDLADIHIIPNGVDTSHYDPDLWKPEHGALVYNGALTYSANLDAVQYFISEIYPILRQKGKDFKLRITGSNKGVDLTAIENCPGVELTGYVSDIRDVLAKSAVCVVPLREGGGSRLKILEAMAAGVPVVSTSMGAEGIDVEHKTQIMLADSAEQFAESIVQVVDNPELTSDLRTAARRFVEQKYDWSSISSRFTKVVESVEHIDVVNG